MARGNETGAGTVTQIGERARYGNALGGSRAQRAGESWAHIDHRAPAPRRRPRSAKEWKVLRGKVRILTIRGRAEQAHCHEDLDESPGDSERPTISGRQCIHSRRHLHRGDADVAESGSAGVFLLYAGTAI